MATHEQITTGGRTMPVGKNIFTSDQDVNSRTAVRTVFTLVALLGMFFPWVTLDGSSSAMNGAELIAYSFTSPERTAMMSVNFIAAVTLLGFPILALVCSVISFLENLKGRFGIVWSIGGMALPVLMLMIASPVLTTEQNRILGVPVPDWGMAITAGAHLALLVLTAMSQYMDREAG